MHDIHTQLAVIGAGPAGVCAALSAARLGVETVLVGNRPVLGGNSSSEIRVWTRGATGAGNMFAEEMGVWGGLKLENLYKNPDANPIFWDEILLDAVLREENLRLYLNTEIAELEMCEGNILAISGVQQGSGNHIRITAEMFLDATGDGVLGNLAGVPWVMGSEPGGETLGNSILYYTKREDHPVPFIPPDYAYSMEQIDNILGRGGRMINERMGGSDCWWFEYGGLLDTIKDSQEIAIELKRLVMGVWNYIKNSGKFESEFYTLEWMGSVPGKRESRRMVTEYVLTSEDILSGRTFYDGGFYGGWYIDSHPAGGVHASGEENCVQVPINVYQIPLRCLYHREVSNLLFAGRIIGVDQNVFFSSRIMNTCALSGQAAATLAATCIRTKLSPAELPEAALREIQQTLLRDDMLIPGYKVLTVMIMLGMQRCV